MNDYERHIEGLQREIAQLRRMQPPLFRVIGKREEYVEVLNIMHTYLDNNAGWVIEVDLRASAKGEAKP